jgi:hypothetical protein
VSALLPKRDIGQDAVVRHLTEQQAVSALRRRAVVEQMLSTDLHEGSFRWLDVRPSAATYTLRLHETVDDGTVDYLDVYEFRSVDEDDEFGEGIVLGEFGEISAVLEAAVEQGANPDRWVNAGVIQDEYRDLLARH